MNDDALPQTLSYFCGGSKRKLKNDSEDVDKKVDATVPRINEEVKVPISNVIASSQRGSSVVTTGRISFLRGAIQRHQQGSNDELSYISKSLNTIKTVGSDCSFTQEREQTRIQRLVKEMQECLHGLNCTATNQELEKWACIIYESMSAPSRTFHSVQHVFDVSVGADCIQKLAAFFHDIVYYSIDGGLSKMQNEMLQDIITEQNGVVAITEEKLDTNMSMTMDIFGFQPGRVLDKFRGLNEFLSASAAVRCYEGNMDTKILAAIVACIEATIPFRKRDSSGRDPAEALFDRLVEVNIVYNLGMTEDELVKIVQRAVDLGNRDLANFSTSEHAVFLSNTWNLLPESNISLRNNTAFRISDFAFALKKMTGFFVSLDPNLIYMSFRDEEHQKIVDERTEMAKDNIRVALKYMCCKGIAIAVVAAIAELTGGDAPLALFLGDLPERYHVSTSVEDHIHIPHSVVDGDGGSVDLEDSVFQLLLHGREAESNFDIKNSPLAAYLYVLMGDQGIEKCSKHVVHPMDRDHAQKLLEAIPPSAAVDILNACAKIAVTRSTALNKMRATFEEKL